MLVSMPRLVADGVRPLACQVTGLAACGGQEAVRDHGHLQYRSRVRHGRDHAFAELSAWFALFKT
jgi:hypothetical protein